MNITGAVPYWNCYFWISANNDFGESALSDPDSGYMALLAGDVNQDCSVNLSDTIIALQVVTGIVPIGTTDIYADINGDDKIGIEEAIYTLKKAAGL